MPILTSVITDRMTRVGLDAENATYYDINLDLIPAINAAIEWLVSVINSAYGSSKFSEEFFRELTNSAVFQTNNYSRIHFTNDTLFTDNIWTIIAVYPDPTCDKDVLDATVLNSSYTAQAGSGAPAGVSVNASGVTLLKHQSLYRPELIHMDSNYDCKRLTSEEWIQSKRNPFAAGNETETNHVEYAYISHIDHTTYKGTTGHAYRDYYSGVNEIEIRPVLDKELVTIVYVKTPDLVDAVTDNIEFPETVTNLLYEKAMQFVSFKQGDGTNIYTVTNNDIQALISSAV